MNEADPILGLDLGTSTCEACVYYQGDWRYIQPDRYYSGRNIQGDPEYPGQVMPSAFSHHDGRPIVGFRALADLKTNRYARQVVRAVKRNLDRDDEVRYELGEGIYSPSDITAEYVKVLRNAAAIELGIRPERLCRAVVAVPASFGPRAQFATLQACIKGGLLEEWVGLVDEPVAAAFPRGLHERPEPQRVLVADLGGGTLDVTLVEVGRGTGTLGFRELGRHGDSRLGGLDWDRKVAEWILPAAKPEIPATEYERLLNDDQDAGHANLFEACESAKKTLTLTMQGQALPDPARPADRRAPSNLYVRFRPTDEPGEISREAEMPGATFVKTTEPLVSRCICVCEELLEDAKVLLNLHNLGWHDLHRVHLTGGGSRLPTVQRQFAAACGQTRLELDKDPQRAVVRGTAQLAEMWRRTGQRPSMFGKPRYPHTIGLLVAPAGERTRQTVFYPLIHRNRELPFAWKERFPIRGNPNSRQLLIVVAEKEDHHDGRPDHRVLINIPMVDLPAPSRPVGNETATISVHCDLSYAPVVEAEFRGQSVRVDLKKLLNRSRPAQ